MLIRWPWDPPHLAGSEALILPSGSSSGDSSDQSCHAALSHSQPTKGLPETSCFPSPPCFSNQATPFSYLPILRNSSLRPLAERVNFLSLHP